MAPSKYPLVFTAVLIVFSTAILADDLPTSDEIKLLSQKAKQIADDFYKKTFEMRMRYEYAGRFIDPNDKVKLFEMATQASADLEKIAQDQNNLKKQIEDYLGDDWETRFGQTALWRRLTADLKQTESEVNELNAVSEITDGTKSGCPPLAIRSGCDSIRTAMQKIKCLGRCEPNEFETIAESLAKSECNNSYEMLLSLAILQNKYEPEKLKNTLSRYPQMRYIFGKIILDCLTSDPNLDSLNPFTAELVAYADSTMHPPEHKDLLLSIAETDRLKTPGLLFIAGNAIEDSDSSKAIELLIESGDLQFRQPEQFLDYDVRAAAEHAIQLAFFSFAQKKIDCNLVTNAYDNYARVASNNIPEKWKYLYGVILLDCGKTQDASAIFTKLADTSKSIERDKASLELLKIKIITGYIEPLPQLRNFILNCAGQDEQKRQLRLEAMNIYCRMMLLRDSNDAAAQVLNLLDTVENTPGLKYDLFRAQALYQLARLEESAQYMSKAVAEDSNSSTVLAAKIASELVNEIELWQKDENDYNELLLNCFTLADFAHKSANTTQTALLFAEVSILQEKRFLTPFSPDENDLTWLRVQARLLRAQENFEQSAKLWAKIAESKRNETAGQNKKSYGWWQAKYYELECMSKLPLASLKDIHHIIEVLQSTYAEIPIPFAEKLESLKHRCVTN